MAAEPRTVQPPQGDSILWIVSTAWEDEHILLPQRQPIPRETWLQAARDYGWRVLTLPDGFIVDGPYAGGVVVALETPNGRHYCALPPAALPALQGLISANDYRVITDSDIPTEIALGDAPSDDSSDGPGADPAGTGTPGQWTVATALWIDPEAWESKQEIKAISSAADDRVDAEMTVGRWVRASRTAGLRLVARTPGVSAPGTPYDGGLVVEMDGRTGRLFFAIPAAAQLVLNEVRGGYADTRG